MINKNIYILVVLVVGLTPLDAEFFTISDGITIGRITFFLLLFFALFKPQYLIPKKKDYYLYILVSFILYVSLTGIFSWFPEITYDRILLLIQYYLITVISSNAINDKVQFVNMIKAYIIACVILCLLIITKTVVLGTGGINAELESLLGNPNENSFLINYGLIFNLIVLKGEDRSSMLYKITPIVLILTIIILASRMGAILLTTIFAIYILGSKLSIKKLSAFLIVVGITVLLVKNYVSQDSINRISNISSDIENANLSNRDEIWENILIIFESSNFNPIIGTGWGTFPMVYNDFFNEFIGSHNFYLNILITTGIMGFTIIIVYLSVLAKKIANTNKKYKLYTILLIVIPMISMLSTNWEGRRWWFLIGLFTFKFVEVTKLSTKQLK